VDDAPSPQIHVAHLGIAHLSFGQTDSGAGGRDQRVLTVPPQGVPMRCIGSVDGIVLAFVTMTPAIENKQERGFPGGSGRCSHVSEKSVLVNKGHKDRLLSRKVAFLARRVEREQLSTVSANLLSPGIGVYTAPLFVRQDCTARTIGWTYGAIF